MVEDNLETREVRAADPAHKEKNNRNAEKTGKKKEKKDKKAKKGDAKSKKNKNLNKTKKVGKTDKKDETKAKKKESKAKKENKKAKKGKKEVNKLKSTKSGSVRQTCPVSDACVATAVSYLKIVQNQAANFINQKSRIERQNTTGSRKNDKKDVFSDALNRLVDFAGGNKSAPACGSLKTGPGVDQIKNKTSTLTDCSAKIKAACDITALPQPNTTFVSGKC